MTAPRAARLGLALWAALAVAATAAHVLRGRGDGRLVVATYALDADFLTLSRAGIAECLVRADFAFGAVEPELAESWSHDGAGLWTFRLRPGVTFHDGAPLTAQAAAEAVASFLGGPEGASLRGLLAARARGDDAVEVRAASPSLPVPGYLARIPVLAAGGRDGRGRVVRPVGTGPFLAARFAPGEGATLLANRRWWGGAVRAERVEVEVVKDPGTRVMLLESGGADWAQMIPRNDAERLAANGYRVGRPDYIYNVYLLFRAGAGAAADPAVRRAVALAVDRERIVRIAFEGTAQPARGLFPPGHALADPALEFPARDPAEAERVLEAAGWRRTPAGGARVRDGRDLEVPLLAVADAYRPAWGTAAELIRQDLERIGARSRIEVLERGAWTGRVDRGEFVATIRGRVPGWWPDPVALLRTDFHSAGTNNACGVRDPALDRAIDEAAGAADAAARDAALRRALGILAREMPLVPLCHDLGREVYAARPEVEGAEGPFPRRNAFPGPMTTR